MKKILLSAAAFSLVVASSLALMPTKAEAIPAFARQTGASCLSCHFQTFPALKPFGRAFKMGSFTDVGDQALVEDDNLSIPSVLNASFVLRGNFTNVNAPGVGSVGTWTVPADAVLMLAGRVGTNTGAFIEFDGTAANWQLLNSFDLGGFKLGIGAHNSGFGASGVLEVSNVFGQHGGKLGGKTISGIQAAGFAQGTVGVGTWIGSDLGYVQLALVSPNAAATGAVNVGLNFGKLVRVVGTFDLGGWDTLIGFGSVTGTAGKQATAAQTAATGIVGARIPMNIQFIDGQIQGDIGDMSLGIYADYAHVKGKTSNLGTGNFYGGGVMNGQTFDAYSVRAELEPVSGILLGLGYGHQKTTVPTGQNSVKTLHLAATYSLYQNFDINVLFDDAKTTTLGQGFTTRTTVLEFEGLM